MRKFIEESEKEPIKVGPITSIENFANEVEHLGDWKSPYNQAAYVKIMLQFVGMYFDYKNNSMLDDGKIENVGGKEQKEYMQMLYNIARKKFPSANDLLDKRGKLQFLISFDEENEMFYRYLAVFVYSFDGISYLAEKSHFVSEVQESGMVYYASDNITDTLSDNNIQQVSNNSKKI